MAQTAVRQLPLFGEESDAPATQRPITVEPSPALDEQIGDYLVHLARVGKAAHTVAATGRDLQQLLDFVGPRDIGRIAVGDLLDFVDKLRTQRGNGPASLRRKVATLKSFFRYVRRQGRLASDPSATVPYPEAVEREAEPLGPGELEKLLEAADAAGHLALMLMMVDAGLKREELLALTWADVVLEATGAGWLFVRRGLAAKRVRERTLPLTPRLAVALRDMSAGGDGSEERSIFDLSTRGVDYVVREAAEKAGVPRRGKLTPQRLRDTFAVRWLAERLMTEAAAAGDEQRQALEARHDLELAELLGLAPNGMAIHRYRRAACLQQQGSERQILPDA